MSRRNLLICFDAFGTLFRPIKPVEQQYGDVARSFGLSGFSDDDVKASFRTAFKSETKKHPNYGKANGMNAERWWTSIIHNTFRPLIAADQQIPRELTSKLLHRFWSDEGYELLPGVMPLLAKLREHYSASNDSVVVGVITNSDERVPDILTSLGLKVAPWRYGSEPTVAESSRGQYDIDFSVMSYDVGHEKPDRRIFSAAEEMLGWTLKAQGGGGTIGDRSSWQKIYVGDEYDKDVVGALEAGWEAVLVNDNDSVKRGDVEWLPVVPFGKWQDLFANSRSLGFSTLAEFARWLPKIA